MVAFVVITTILLVLCAAIQLYLSWRDRVETERKDRQSQAVATVHSQTHPPEIALQGPSSPIRESQPSTSEHVKRGVTELIQDLSSAALTDMEVARIMDASLTERDQILNPLRSFFLSVLSQAKRDKVASGRTAVLGALRVFLEYIESAQTEIAVKGCEVLQEFHSGGLVDVVVLADYSSVAAKILSKLAVEHFDKLEAIRIYVLSSSPHFISLSDTQRWREFFTDEMSKIYHVEFRPFDRATELFEQLELERVQGAFLCGAERILPDGRVFDLPGIAVVAGIARARSFETLVVAECYKVQPSLQQEPLGFGVAADGERIGLTSIEPGASIQFISEHKSHTLGASKHLPQSPLMCCHRFWLNRMERKHYPIGIIFDLDGTLLNSEDIHKRLYQEGARTIGVDLSDREYEASLRGKTDSDTFGDICRQVGKDSQTKRLVLAKQKKFLKLLQKGTVPGMPGATSFVHSLREQLFILALATSAPSADAYAAIETLGLQSTFSAVLSAESVAHGKPNPEVYRKASDALGLAPSECLVYEDSFSGIQSAIAAGMQVVAIGDANDKRFRQLGVAAVIANFEGHVLPEIRD